MAHVEIARAATEDLDRLIAFLNLPSDTRERVRRASRPLEQFPSMGAELSGMWEGFRFLLGPWRWMLIVYAVIDDADGGRVVVVTIQDARSSEKWRGGS